MTINNIHIHGQISNHHLLYKLGTVKLIKMWMFWWSNIKGRNLGQFFFNINKASYSGGMTTLEDMN